MKIFRCLCVIFSLLAVRSYCADAGNRGMSEASVDGQYAMMPLEASEHTLLSQDLGSLLLEPRKFENLSITGKIESIKLTVSNKELNIMAFDSTGARVLSETVPASHEIHGNTGSLTLSRRWKGNDEWGSSQGTTTVRLLHERDGSLMVFVSVASSGRTLIFPRGQTKSDAWLKYAPIVFGNAL